MEPSARPQETEEEGFPHPPADWHSQEGWERYWKRVLSTTRISPLSLGYIAAFMFLEAMPLFRERRLSRILFAGNGISLLPHCFAHCGFEVVALDIAPAASQFVESYPLSPKVLARFLTEYEEQKDEDGMMISQPHLERSLKRVAKEHRPGGSLTVVTEDMFGYAPTQKFDVIFSARAYQGFVREDRQTLAHLFFEWLNPGGICQLELINIPDRAEMELPFAEAGFEIQQPLCLPEPRGWWERLKRRCWGESDTEAYARLDAERAVQECALLDAGKKLVIFCYGSG